MKTLFLSVVVLFSTTTASYSQDIKEQRRKNSIEVYMPICHFFDGTETNWTILVPSSGTVYGLNKVFFQNKDVKIPTTFGLQYSRYINSSNGITLSGLIYTLFYMDKNLQPGDIMSRQYRLFSAGYSHEYIGNEKIKINGIVEINYRHGSEMVYIYSPYVWEKRVENLQLRDVGISAGLKIERSLLFNFLISGEAKYTRFVYRYSEGVDFFGLHKDSTPNTLTLKLGLGYRF